MTTLQESVNRALVRDNDKSIKTIENPSEEVCLIAISKSASNLEYIKQPTPEIMFTAVLKSPDAIAFLSKENQEIVLDNLGPHFSTYQMFTVFEKTKIRTASFIKVLIKNVLANSFSPKTNIAVLSEIHTEFDKDELINFLYKYPKLIKEVSFIKKTILKKVSEKLVKENYRNIQYIPEEFHDKLHPIIMKQLPAAVSQKYYGSFSINERPVNTSDMKWLFGIRFSLDKGGFIFEYQNRYLVKTLNTNTYDDCKSIEDAKEILTERLGDLTLEFNYAFSSNAEKFILSA